MRLSYFFPVLAIFHLAAYETETPDTIIVGPEYLGGAPGTYSVLGDGTMTMSFRGQRLRSPTNQGGWDGPVNTRLTADSYMRLGGAVRDGTAVPHIGDFTFEWSGGYRPGKAPDAAYGTVFLAETETRWESKGLPSQFSILIGEEVSPQQIADQNSYAFRQLSGRFAMTLCRMVDDVVSDECSLLNVSFDSPAEIAPILLN
jgi:hypothetical protein